MASIQLRAFGGMAPSANPQAIPEAVATFVQNLDLRYGDFRPLASPANVVAATAGQSLYRFESTGTFITRPVPVNFVRGPIPNDATERTYYTGDGAPKVVDNTGAIRQLGVPQPGAAPAASVVVTDEFSEDDAKAARLSKFYEMLDVVRANLTHPYYGLSQTDLGVRFAQDPGDPAIALLRIPGTYAGGSYSATNGSHNNLNDARLGFRLGSESPGTTIAYATLVVKGQGADVDAGMTNALKAILMPNSALPLIAPEMAASVTAAVKEGIKAADKARDDAIARMKPLLASFLSLADKGDPGIEGARGEIEAFYAKPEIVGAISAAVGQAVSSTISAMRGYTGGSATPLPITGKPGAPDTYQNAN